METFPYTPAGLARCKYKAAQISDGSSGAWCAYAVEERADGNYYAVWGLFTNG